MDTFFKSSQQLKGKLQHRCSDIQPGSRNPTPCADFTDLSLFTSFLLKHSGDLLTIQVNALRCFVTS